MTEIDSIASHSLIAPHYKHRAPYLTELFAGLAGKLGLNPRSCPLDVCCGAGEVAARLAVYAGKIYAIDGSVETANRDRFLDDLGTELSAYVGDGKLDSVLLNWALIFRRRKG